MRRILCIFLCVALLLTCVSLPAFAAGYDGFRIESLEQYCVHSEELAKDGYIGIPVGIKTYAKGNSTAQSQVILYVVNTNTERIGTDSDETIITSMLERGYVVVVLDYQNHASSVSPDLDWSIQAIRNKVGGGQFLGGAQCNTKVNYVVPAGYNVTLDEYYWAIDKHGSVGTLDKIVEIWNNDFKSVKKDSVINYPDGTSKKVSEVTAQDIYDCVKKDGSPIDMDLRMDIIYPTNPAQKVPVYSVASSSELRVDTWTSSMRPHLTGFLFAGYAGVVFDYAYTPMARTDHYGYFDGDGSGSVGGITGDNYTYSVSVFNGIKSDTAAIRKIRWLSDYEGDKYKFDVDKIGVYGNSKGGLCTRLGNQHPELLREQRYFDGHYGETRYEIGDTADDGRGIIDGGEAQPWLTYSDGTPIPSNVQFVYANCGGGYDDITYGHAPTFASGSMMDGSYQGFYPGVVNACRTYDIPCVYLSMPELGHALVYGTDKDYGLDGYKALFDMAHYYLKGDGPILQYIDIEGGTQNVDAKAGMKFKFAGSVPKEEIQKITVTNSVTGDRAAGTWTASYGNTEWVFQPHNLKGGYEYVIDVPTTIKGDNGAALQQSRTMRFTVKHEQMLGASKLTSDADMTLLKTASVDNGVYYLFEGTDFSASTTIGMRFSVENDAANTVLVYGVDAIDEENLANSTAGALLAEVPITGAGDYEIDVTDYVKGLASHKAAFILKAKKNQETKVLSHYDFENEPLGATSVGGMNLNSRTASAVSDEMNATSGGARSLKISHMLHNNYKNGQYHVWIEGNYQIALLSNLIQTQALDASDMGRKFHISFNLYDETSRRVTYRLSPWSSSNFDNIDWEANMYYEQSKANEWNNFSFEYRIDDEKDIRINKKTFSIVLESTMPNGKTGAAYLDDIKVTEDITDVKIAGAASESAFAPSLVLHPAEKLTLNSAGAAYVESGDNADKTMGGGVYISGRARQTEKAAAKSYIKLDLSAYDDGQAYFGFKTTEASKGTIAVYGIKDKELAANWSAQTINYLNAPANDRYSTGVTLDEVFEGAPLAEYSVSGAEEYTVDIASYVRYMKAIGASYATLVFVNDSSTEMVIDQENFDEKLSRSVVPGGGIAKYGRTTAEDHTGSGGGSYYMTPTEFAYERIRIDFLDYKTLTEKDIGRKFRLTYWAKATAPMSYFNATMASSSTDNSHNKITHQIDTANEWKQIVYEFTLTDKEIVDPSNTATGIFGLIDFEAVTPGETLYIDDVVLEEIGLGSVQIIPVDNVKTDKIVANINFDNWEEKVTNATGYREVNGKTGIVAGSGFEADTKYSVTAAEDATSGAGKSFLFVPNQSYNRLKFYNIFDHNLTETDVGRKLKVSFKVKTDAEGTFRYGLMSTLPRMTTGKYTLSEGYTPDSADYSTGMYPTANTATVTAEDVGRWKTYSFDVAIKQEMLPKNVLNGWDSKYYDVAIGLLGIIPGDTLKGKNIYIDDILVTEPDVSSETKVPYTYIQDFEKVTDAYAVASGNGMEFRWIDTDGTLWNEAIDGLSRKQIDKWEISNMDNYTVNGAKSFKGTSHASWNRFKLMNIMDTLTEDMIGIDYKITFYLKANRTGYFNIGLIGDNSNKTYGATPYMSTKIDVDTANEWKKYTYTFTVDQEIVDNNINFLLIGPQFGQKMTDTTDETSGKKYSVPTNTVEFYIDDLYATELVPGAGTGLAAVEQVSVMGDGSVYTDTLYVNGSKAEKNPKYIRKAYLRFDGGAYQHTQKATLCLNVEEANGQTIKLWGVKDANYPAELNYNTAPASDADESMLSAEVYGGVPIAQIKAEHAGQYEIDVTGFIADNAPNDYIFALTSEDIGGTEYIGLDFETYSFMAGADYAPFGGFGGSVRRTEGAAVVEGIANAGEGIQIYNVFGSGNAVCSAGETYTVSVDVTPLGESAYPVTMGLCSAEGVPALGASVTETIAAGETKRMEFVFTANASEKLNTLALYGGAAGGFKLDNVVVKSANMASLQDSASLLIEKAQEPGGEEPLPSRVSIKRYDAESKTAVIEADTACTAIVIFAGYANDLLIDVKLVNIELKQGENEIKAEGFDMTGAVSGCVMVWDSATGIKPLCKAYPF